MIEDWMASNNIVSFRLFSESGVSELPKGWESPEEFELDGAVFYTGDSMHIFTNEIHKVLVKSKKTHLFTMDLLQKWLDDYKDSTFIGYHSTKFDIPLLARDYNIDIKHIDLADIVFDSSKEHYTTYGRRYDIHTLSELNNASQSILPDLSFMLKPITRLSEWRRGLSRNVIRTLAVEAELIAKLYSRILIHEEITIMDERTERPVTISCANVRDLVVSNVKLTNSNPIISNEEE